MSDEIQKREANKAYHKLGLPHPWMRYPLGEVTGLPDEHKHWLETKAKYTITSGVDDHDAITVNIWWSTMGKFPVPEVKNVHYGEITSPLIADAANIKEWYETFVRYTISKIEESGL